MLKPGDLFHVDSRFSGCPRLHDSEGHLREKCNRIVMLLNYKGVLRHDQHFIACFFANKNNEGDFVTRIYYSNDDLCSGFTINRSDL